MKKTFLFLAVITVVMTSCRHDIIFQDVVIPANTEIVYVESTDKEINGFFLVSGDTTGNGIPDITVRVQLISLMERISFLRQVYPDQDIIIGSGNISLRNGEFVFDAGGANVAGKIKIKRSL